MALRFSPKAAFSFSKLVKLNLSALVLLSTAGGFAMAPAGGPLAATLLGTSMCIASANTFNQWIEHSYDSQMARTRVRPLAVHSVSQARVFLIGAGLAAGGAAVLYTVNPITCFLGTSNILLYALVYTPMKRTSIANTWVGAVVGAIPPLMGWTACTLLNLGTASIDPGALVMASLLFAWQFPHFNALAYNLRQDYSKAGYRMMAVTDTELNARVSLRYSLAMFPISLAACMLHLTSPWFMLVSAPIHGWMAFRAYEFYKESNSCNARKLFFASLWHLPAAIALMIVMKDRRPASVVG